MIGRKIWRPVVLLSCTNQSLMHAHPQRTVTKHCGILERAHQEGGGRVGLRTETWPPAMCVQFAHHSLANGLVLKEYYTSEVE